jgi:hypothetical protein
MGAYQKGDPFGSPAFEALRRFLEEADREPGAVAGTFEEFEGKLRRYLNGIETEVLGGHLKRFDVSAPEIEVKGERYRKKMPSEQPYTCQAGTVRVERNLYVPVKGEGKAISPMELRAGIVEGSWTPRAAKLMLRAVAGTTPKDAEGFFGELGGMRPSKSSLDRLPKKASEIWEEKRQEFERELRVVEPIPELAVAVAVSLDGVLLPMKGTDRVEKRTQDKKRPQGPAGYREASCGTISFYDDEGRRLSTIKYGRMPEERKETLKSELEAELRGILEAEPGLELQFLSDGAPDHWRYFDGLALRLGREDAKQALDLWHALERIKKALDAYHGEQTPESKGTFEEFRVWLREMEDGPERVLRALRYRRDHSRGSKRAVIESEIQFLAKRKHLMRYAALAKENLPVGSGVVEAACKTLVTERMKRSGMSWEEEGGQAVLTLRSLLQSNRWERGWRMLAEEYRQEVTEVTRITPVPKRRKKAG